MAAGEAEGEAFAPFSAPLQASTILAN